ncbi:MAG TPA: hypothetical protein VGN15_13470, partial [Ktedonobacteraceae bacterium]|nr:hypothetical protein [Ktedonobacteraceae bacterium]
RHPPTVVHKLRFAVHDLLNVFCTGSMQFKTVSLPPTGTQMLSTCWQCAAQDSLDRSLAGSPPTHARAAGWIAREGSRQSRSPQLTVGMGELEAFLLSESVDVALPASADGAFDDNARDPDH